MLLLQNYYFSISSSNPNIPIIQHPLVFNGIGLVRLYYTPTNNPTRIDAGQKSSRKPAEREPKAKAMSNLARKNCGFWHDFLHVIADRGNAT